MKHRSVFLIGTLSTLAACGALFAKGPHVPSAYQGTTEITVANGWNHELCGFSLFAAGNANDNWLGTGGKLESIAPGARRTFQVKPGTYHVLGAFCDNGQAVGAAGTYGGATATIEGPSVIALGPQRVAPIAGAKKLGFPKIYTAQQAAGGDSGGEQAAEEPASEPASGSSPSSSSSATSAEPASTGSKCLAHGAVCNDNEHCCSGMSCASRTKFSDGTFGNGYCQ